MATTDNVMSRHVVANTSPLHVLDERQTRFVKEIVAGRPPQTAARIAGYAEPQAKAYQVLKYPKIQDAIRYLYKKHEKAADMTRKKVMDGFLEAIEFAKMQADAGNMIAGWREIGRMCGYYAPEVKKIDINITAKRVIDKLETLSDEDLLQIVDESAQIIEGEATAVLETAQIADDTDFRAKFEP